MAAPAPGEARVGPGQQVNDIYVRIKIIHSTKYFKTRLKEEKKRKKNTHSKIITNELIDLNERCD